MKIQGCRSHDPVWCMGWFFWMVGCSFKKVALLLYCMINEWKLSMTCVWAPTFWMMVESLSMGNFFQIFRRLNPPCQQYVLYTNGGLCMHFFSCVNCAMCLKCYPSKVVWLHPSPNWNPVVTSNRNYDSVFDQTDIAWSLQPPFKKI